ncbi:MAG: YjgN family protein [Hyphomicrobiales bacterium]
MQDGQAIQSPPEALRFSYVPRKGLLKLTIVNFLLTLVTLTIYRFWAKTNVRRHIWSCVHINGEPLEYTGTGKELFLGALVVFGVFILPYLLLVGMLSLAYGSDHPAVFMIQMLFFLIVYVMWGFAVYRARKYQLSRTNWRGIRGDLVGSAMTYSLLYFGSQIARSMSFGWATPVMNTVLQEQIINDMRFGDAAFKFKGRAGPLYPTYAICWVLSLVGIVALIMGAGAFLPSQGGTAGWSEDNKFVWLVGGGFAIFLLLTMLFIPALWSIYIAKEIRTFANYSRFDGAQFHLDATAGSVIGLAVGNILILVLTLGIGWPYINQRTVRFVVDRLSLRLIDVDCIRQSQTPLLRRGEDCR